MFNVECYKLHDRSSLEFFRGMLLNGDPGGYVFFEANCQKRGLNFSWGYVSSIQTMDGSNFIVFSL